MDLEKGLQPENKMLNSFKAFEITKFNIIKSPEDFFKILIQKLKNAKNVYIACLFMGHTGKGKIIMDILEARIKSQRPTVICLDKVQQLRFGDFIKDMKRRKIYQSIHFIDCKPDSILPNIVKEILGVFHDKVFVFDDEVCITGANLHTFYFENRIDRYYLIDNQKLSDFIIKDMFELNNVSYISVYCYKFRNKSHI